MADSKLTNTDHLPEFEGNVASYRKWRRRVVLYHAGQEDNKRPLTGPRVLAKLVGAAAEACDHLDAEAVRQLGEAGLESVLDALDKLYQWQPESVLFKALEEYLYLAARKQGESITALLARYRNALAEFLRVIQQHMQQEAEKRYQAAVEAHVKAKVEWLAAKALA